MKNIVQRTMIAVVTMFATQAAMPASWRINYDTTKGAHFTSINDAMASENVLDGDTLYLDPGCVIYLDNQTISKAVTVIGTGWGYTDKPYVPARIDKNLYVTAKATLIGLWVKSTLYLRNTGIELERCRVEGTTYVGSTDYTAQHVEVRQCYMGRITGVGQYDGRSRSLKIFNSYLYSNSSEAIIKELKEVEIVNCMIVNNYSSEYVFSYLSNAVIKNSIIAQTKSKNYIFYSFDNCIMQNNVLSADPASWSYVSKYPNNVFANSTALTTYIVNSGAGGANLQLCENSPAKGAGEGGIDCGPYAEGSLYPFVTYGLPEHIPHFTEAVIPANPTDGKVKVTLKIENQNR